MNDSIKSRLIGHFMEYTFEDKLLFNISEDTFKTIEKEMNDSLFYEPKHNLSTVEIKEAWKEAIDIILYGMDMFHGSIFDVDAPACRYVYLDMIECAKEKLYQAIDTLEIK